MPDPGIPDLVTLARQAETDPFAHWDLLTASPGQHASTRRQIETDLANGRLRMLDRTTREPCEEPWWHPRTGRLPCPGLAVVFDSERQRRNCPGCAFSFADSRAVGRPEYPAVDQYDNL